jgi:molybdate transport system regulatory protein
MKVSARNAFKGKVSSIAPGAVNAEVTIQTDGGDTLVAIVTSSSIKSLGLSAGKAVVALVKAPWVMLASGDSGLQFSARNQLKGTITTLLEGAVNAEVGLTLPGGTQVFAVVTNDAVAELGLAKGQAATAVIKASHIILAVEG